MNSEKGIMDSVTWVYKGRLRRICLEELRKSPKPPSTIAEKTDRALSNISKVMGELQGEGLIECINPKDNKFRFYKLTEKGNEVLNIIKKVDS